MSTPLKADLYLSAAHVPLTDIVTAADGSQIFYFGDYQKKSPGLSENVFMIYRKRVVIAALVGNATSEEYITEYADGNREYTKAWTNRYNLTYSLK